MKQNNSSRVDPGKQLIKGFLLGRLLILNPVYVSKAPEKSRIAKLFCHRKIDVYKRQGYAYAGPLHVRAAYAWSVETSIYVKKDYKGKGTGRTLYEALEYVLKKQNVINSNACIAYPEKEDQFLTRDSVKFHSRLGYQKVAEFHKCAYKFGTWYNMVWMEKFLSEHPRKPQAFRPFEEVRKEFKEWEP